MKNWPLRNLARNFEEEGEAKANWEMKKKESETSPSADDLAVCDQQQAEQNGWRMFSIKSLTVYVYVSTNMMWTWLSST